jgi:putative ABC transport system permease protein
MSLYLLQGAVEEGFIYAFVALGLFISYKVLDIADLTTDGSFALGGVVAAVITNSGHAVLGLPAAFLAGALAGLVTAFLQTRMKVPAILSGIITMTALYSINLMVMGGAPNMYFPKAETLFTLTERVFGESMAKLATLSALAVIAAVLIVLFMRTKLGLSIRATGDNRDMVSASSINPSFTVTVGLCLSNGLIALGGALWAQAMTQGDINIGTGTVVIGLASLILGSVAFRSGRMLSGVCGAVLGAVIYRLALTVALRATANAGYLKLVSACIVALVIAYPAARDYVAERIRRRREARSNAEAE